MSPTPERATARDAVNRLAREFQREQWSTGDIAALRRLDARRRQVGDAGFWKVATLALDDVFGEEDGDEKAGQWMAVLQGLAVIYDLHQQNGPRLGCALAQAEVSNRRMTQLLRAQGDGLLTEVRRLARLLRSRGQNVRWGDVADLVLSEGRSHHEEVRRHIARDYFHETRRSQKTD